MRNSPARVSAASLTSRLKSSRMRVVASWPTTAPKTSRIAKVRLAETAASLHLTGQLLGRNPAGHQETSLPRRRTSSP